MVMVGSSRARGRWGEMSGMRGGSQAGGVPGGQGGRGQQGQDGAVWVLAPGSPCSPCLPPAGPSPPRAEARSPGENRALPSAPWPVPSSPAWPSPIGAAPSRRNDRLEDSPEASAACQEPARFQFLPCCPPAPPSLFPFQGHEVVRGRGPPCRWGDPCRGDRWPLPSTEGLWRKRQCRPPAHVSDGPRPPRPCSCARGAGRPGPRKTGHRGARIGGAQRNPGASLLPGVRRPGARPVNPGGREAGPAVVPGASGDGVPQSTIEPICKSEDVDR